MFLGKSLNERKLRYTMKTFIKRHCNVLLNILLAGIVFLLFLMVLLPELADNTAVFVYRRIAGNDPEAVHKEARRRLSMNPATMSDVDLVQHFLTYTLEKPMDPLYTTHPWQSIGAPFFEAYVISAFYDDRDILDPIKPSVKEPRRVFQASIKVLGIAQKHKSRTLCIFWYRNSLRPQIILANKTSLGPRPSLEVEAVMYACPVPLGKWPPEYVSIMSEQSMIPSCLVPVLIPERPPQAKDICACIGLYKGHYDPYQIVEWFTIFDILGFEEIHAYNHSVDPDILRIFKHYEIQNILRIYHMPRHVTDAGESIEDILAVVAMNECLLRNAYRCSRIALQNDAAILVPKEDYTYLDMLTNINMNVKDRNHPKSFVFPKAYFYYDFEALVPDPDFLVTNRYMIRVNSSSYADGNSSIVVPLACSYVTNYTCARPREKYNYRNWQISVGLHLGETHYYRHCREDQKAGRVKECNKSMEAYYYDDTLLTFTEDLTRKVVEAAWRLNLIDVTDYDSGRIERDLNPDQELSVEQRATLEGQVRIDPHPAKPDSTSPGKEPNVINGDSHDDRSAVQGNIFKDVNTPSHRQQERHTDTPVNTQNIEKQTLNRNRSTLRDNLSDSLRNIFDHNSIQTREDEKYHSTKGKVYPNSQGIAGTIFEPKNKENQGHGLTTYKEFGNEKGVARNINIHGGTERHDHIKSHMTKIPPLKKTAPSFANNKKKSMKNDNKMQNEALSVNSSGDLTKFLQNDSRTGTEQRADKTHIDSGVMNHKSIRKQNAMSESKHIHNEDDANLEGDIWESNERKEKHD